MEDFNNIKGAGYTNQPLKEIEFFSLCQGLDVRIRKGKKAIFGHDIWL
jgi:hypothetical protein